MNDDQEDFAAMFEASVKARRFERGQLSRRERTAQLHEMPELRVHRPQAGQRMPDLGGQLFETEFGEGAAAGKA